MAERIYVGTKAHHRDAIGEKTRARIVNDLGIGTVSAVRTAAVYIFNGLLSRSELETIAAGPLCDPIIQDYTINTSFLQQFDWLIEVGFRPGVTDNVGRTAREAVAVCLKGRSLPPDFSVHTAIQYFVEGTLSRHHVERIANELLANELVHTVRIYTCNEWLERQGTNLPAPIVYKLPPVEPYRVISLDISDEELLRLSRENHLALSLEEMKAIRSYFADADTAIRRAALGLPPQPTNVELEILAQTWSEHCKHKIFNARITYYEEDRNPQTISNLFKVYIQKATQIVRTLKGEHDLCLSVFSDNAGVIRFNDRWAVAFKVETHNSPSALDPYGGALTGIVGVNRDPFGTGLGARLIANTNVFCFATPFYDRPLPPRILHPKRVFEGVREGVEHGGNKSGIPTINGTIVFDDRYLGKPLVYCGTLGILPIEIGGRPAYVKKAQVGDRIVMTGGRIGKDGIHGATFSSEPLHEGSPATAVQIGDPITQKRMTDFLLRARDRGLYNSLTDNGAGGLSSSIGEMACDTNGAIVHLERAPLKYEGLEPWEIFLSEAQERMTVAVPPRSIEAFLAMAKEWNVEATDLGEFTDSGYLQVVYKGVTVAYLSMDFLHHGLPQMQLTARWSKKSQNAPKTIRSSDLGRDLLALLKRLNICSKEWVVRQYDHEVQGGSVIKPLCGARNDGPSDAAVIRPLLDSYEGLAIANGIVPRYGDIDTYAMAACAFDEAVRNAVCVGGDPDRMAALDNFCWCDPVAGPGNPDAEYKLGQLVRANQALYSICLHYGIPLISGKDSMKNDYHIGETRISIPPTLLISVVALMSDVRRAVTMDFKCPGNLIFLVGTTYRELGASEYAAMSGMQEELTVPYVHTPQRALKAYRMVHALINQGCIRACHDLSDGGLAVALAEMCFAGECGAAVDLSKVRCEGCTTDAEVLFSESQSRLLLEVPTESLQQVEAMLGDLAICIGEVTRGDRIVVRGLGGGVALDVSRIDAKAAWKNTLNF